MKKFWALLAAGALSVSVLAGCGGGSSSSSSSSSASTDDTTAGAVESVAADAAETVAAAADGQTYRVAFLPTDMSLTFASWLAEELDTAFEQYPNLELTTLDSQNVLETQLSNMENCVSQGYDYIILLPIEPAAEDDIVAGYIDQGTPIMNINLDDFGVEKASSVIANPYDLGTAVATYAKEQLADDANVVVLLGPSGNTDSIERRRAYDDVLFSQTHINILEEQIANWEKSEGMDLMESWLTKYGNDGIDAVISMNDAMAIGAYEAAKDAGADDILFFGVDGLADAAVSIEEGGLTATALQDAQVMAQEAARIVNEVLTGQNTEGYEKVQIPVTLITKDNVQEFIDRYTANGMISE